MCPAAFVDCPHRHVGCAAAFQRAAADAHLRACPYEALKGLLAEKDGKIHALTKELEKLRAKGKAQLLPRWESQW